MMIGDWKQTNKKTKNKNKKKDLPGRKKIPSKENYGDDASKRYRVIDLIG